MPGFDDTQLVAARNEQQRPVRRRYVIKKHGDVHGTRLRHFIIAFPRAVILVPLPYGTIERRLGVDLVLVHVKLTIENLGHRVNQTGVRTETAKRFVVLVRGKRRPCDTIRLTPHFLAVKRVNGFSFALQQRGFFG